MRYRYMLIELLAILTSLLLFAVASAFMINGYVVKSAEPYIITPEEATDMDADCILVLGAKVNADNTLSLILEHRVLTGIELYNSGASDRILMSGDHGRESYDEVNAMKNYAMTSGIDKSAVFADHAGFSTYESVYRARDVFCCNKIIIVTQEFHLSRAVYLARMLGLEAYGVACDRGEYSTAAKNNAREFLARIKAVYSAVIKPKPTYLGEAIPIWGDGSKTDG